MRNASDLVLAHGDGRIPPTGKDGLAHFRGRRKLQKLKRQELEEILETAFLGREEAGIVALTKSNLLNVDRGKFSGTAATSAHSTSSLNAHFAVMVMLFL